MVCIGTSLHRQLFSTSFSSIPEFPDYGALVGAGWVENHMYPLGGSIRNRLCTLARPIRIGPCILGRPIRNPPGILGGTIENFCLAKFSARISANLSANWAICRKVQARTSVKVHSVKAFVMPHFTVILQNLNIEIWQTYINMSVQHFEHFLYSARWSAI